MRSKVCFATLVFAALLAGVPATVRADSRTITSANELMQKRMFKDAIRILEPSVAKQGDADAGPELRLIGESYYMLKEYGNARTFFLRALPQQKTPNGKISCEARLAVLDYRLGDLSAADERIGNFLRLYPADERVGTLLSVRIRIIQEGRLPGPEKIKRIEEEYVRIANEKERFGFYNYVLAAQALGELYISSGNDPKAIALYVRAANEMKSTISKLQVGGEQVGSDLLQGVDGMSMQVARYYFGRKEYNEAQKWLETVNFDPEMKSQAKYLLAQLFYQKSNFKEVTGLLSDELIDNAPDGEAKWGMCMLAGFSWRDSKTPNLEKAKELLKRIPSTSSGYAQAQHGLADIYREQKDSDRAEANYLESVKNPKYAPNALFYLAGIQKDRADAMKPKSEAEKQACAALYKKSGEYIQRLILEYPLSDMAKTATNVVKVLISKGVAIEVKVSDDEKIAAWDKTIREKPNSAESAQALMSLAQHHAHTVVDPKSKNITKAPNWKAVVEACQPFIKSSQPFANVSPERWKELQAQAYYFLGRAELGSLPPGGSTKRLQSLQAEQPVRIDGGGSLTRALELLRQAQQLTSPQQQAYREIDYALMEAMFKSEDRAVREAGERRYAEMEPKYASDPNYQRLAAVTADWLDEHGQHEAAARTYRSLARKAHLDRDEVMQLLYLAGMNYGKAGRAMQESTNQPVNLAFMVQPRVIIRTSTTIFRSHPPFQFVKRILWEPQGPNLSAAEALTRISREFSVPFVWNPEAGNAVANYLRNTVITRATLNSWREPRTLAEYYDSVVGTNRFAVDFDLGATGGKPTIPVPEGGDENARALEIYDPAQTRFPALAKPYGDFAALHGTKTPTMLLTIIKRIETVTGSRVLWNENIPKDDALSQEFRELPGGRNVPCTEALRATLESIGLRYEVVRRDPTRELIQESNDTFDELRKFGADARYAEDAMYNIAVNLYVVKDYSRMKILLREYLKTYDNPSFLHYYEACFWLGRLYEIDRNISDAVKYYLMAAEERVVLYRLPEGSQAPTIAEIKSRLSYETLFNLSRKDSGSFQDDRLEDRFAKRIRFNTNVQLAIDPSARSLPRTITRESYLNVPCIELLHDVMFDLGLDLRTENGDPGVAEKAYFRLAQVYKEDNLMHEALEYISTMLARFPKSPRRPDALKLKLDIYKGLRDYAKALTTLEELRVAAEGRIEAFRLDYEKGRIYFDMCDYPTAEQSFAGAMLGTQAPDELCKIREALAITYLRMTNRWNEALSSYRNIAQYETAPVRQSVNATMIWFLECATARPPVSKPMPEREKTFITNYGNLSEAQRGDLDANEIARATWIYYAAGLVDLWVSEKRTEALEKFNAAASSSDPFLSGEALYQAGMLYMATANPTQARATFEHLLFATKAVEPTVKATYALAQCLAAMNEAAGALRRLEELVARYPASPYAELAKQHPLYLARHPPVTVPPVGGLTTSQPPPAATRTTPAAGSATH